MWISFTLYKTKSRFFFFPKQAWVHCSYSEALTDGGNQICKSLEQWIWGACSCWSYCSDTKLWSQFLFLNFYLLFWFEILAKWLWGLLLCVLNTVIIWQQIKLSSFFGYNGLKVLFSFGFYHHQQKCIIAFFLFLIQSPVLWEPQAWIRVAELGPARRAPTPISTLVL